MHLFLDLHDPRPGHRRGLRDRRLGARPHLHDLGHLQLRPGRHGHAGGLHLLAVPLRLELAGAAGPVRRDRGAGAAAGRGPLRRHHAGAAADGGGDQDRGHHRHHARADRVGPVDLEPRRAADRQPLLRRGGQVQGPRRLRHRPRGDRPRAAACSSRWGSACCSRAPAPAWPCGRWSTTPSSSSSTAVGPNGWPRSPGRSGGALAALAGILITPISGGTLDVHVLTLLVLDSIAAAMFGRLRSIWRTFGGALVLGLAGTYVLGYFPSSWSWASNFRIALPMIVLFVVLLVLPQDRLRGATLLRTRERFTVPTMRSAAHLGRDPDPGGPGPGADHGHQATWEPSPSASPTPSSPCRSRSSPATPVRSTWPRSPSGPSPPSSCSTSGSRAPGPVSASPSGASSSAWW